MSFLDLKDQPGYTSQTFIAKEGQLRFDIEGDYERGLNRVEVYIDGNLVDFEEYHTSKISLKSPAVEGSNVEVIWYAKPLPKYPTFLDHEDVGAPSESELSDLEKALAQAEKDTLEEFLKTIRKNSRGTYPLGEKSFLQEVDGDLWITANCYFDRETLQWMRIDETKISFGLQMQGTGSIAFETVQGFNVWKAAPAPNPLGPIASVGGWEIAMLFTGHSNTVIGGMNFEIDGSGASPEFGRINQLAEETYFSRNCYFDGVRFVHDKVLHPAIAIRINNRTGAFELLRAPRGAEEDIPYDGSGSNQPTVVWEEPLTLWHDKTTDLRSAVHATQLAPQSFVADSWNNISFTRELYDNLGEFDEPGIFTAKETGIYSVTTSVAIASMPLTGRFVLTTSVNGAERSRLVDTQVAATGSQFSVNGSATLKLNRGDYFSIFSYTSRAITTVPGDVLTHLEITKIA